MINATISTETAQPVSRAQVDAVPVAKSLHTVKVITQVARALGSVDAAMDVLGLSGRPDPYGLRAKASKGL